jgi:hypothetical protein
MLEADMSIYLLNQIKKGNKALGEKEGSGGASKRRGGGKRPAFQGKLLMGTLHIF